MGRKSPQMAPSRTSVHVPVSGTCTIKVLPDLPWVVPIPLSGVPVPDCYDHCVAGGTGTSKCGIGTKFFFYLFIFFIFYFFWWQYQFIEISNLLFILDFTGCYQVRCTPCDHDS